MKASLEITQNTSKIPNSGYMEKRGLRALELSIVKEILELDEIKGCLSYFLASHNSMLYPETAVQAKAQKTFVFENLKELYAELKEVRELLQADAFRSPKVINLMPSEDEIKAIQLFNQDRRFTINE